MKTIDKQKYKDWAISELKSPEFMQFVDTQIFVIRQKDFSKHFELHIYVYSDNDVRLVLYDVISLKALHTMKITNNFFEVIGNIGHRLDVLYKMGQSQQLCPKCKAHQIERTNGSNGNKFMGCSAYPKCPRGLKLNREYPLREIVVDSRITMEEEIGRHNQKLGSLPLQSFTNLVEDKDCINTKDYELAYSFEKFNRVQSTLIQKELHKKNINLVLGTSTSSGKTVCAELFANEIFKQNKKVIYVAPLKALSQEKYDGWIQGVFKDKEIVMLTGDTLWNTQERTKQLRKAESADIIIMTSELLDSLSRSLSDKDSWIRDVGLVILDESHIISTGRGHCVEVGLMRFSKINSDAKILCLSATLPNVEDFKKWLKILNNKETEVINSDWRPTKLTWIFSEYEGIGGYYEQQEDKINKAVEIVQSKKEESCLLFVHDKTIGRKLLKRLIELEIEVEFHNADMKLDKRLDIESRFEEGMNVLIATSTLAWGRNLPAVNVIILGVTRGLNAVDELDILQEGGRAGRLGLTNEGFVYLICDDKLKWEYKVNHPRNVESTLLDEGILGFHILAEVKIGSVKNFETLQKWFERSLAYTQKKWNADLMQRVLKQLVSWNMLYIDNLGNYKLTGLGKISANLYYIPQDIYHWYKEFGKVNDKNLWDNDLVLAWALGSVPSQDFGYVPRDAQERVLIYTNALKKVGLNVNDSVKACDLYDCITGNEVRQTISNFKFDSERIKEALIWIDKVARWNKESVFKQLTMRVKYNIGKELVDLCMLSGIGHVKAGKLFKIGVCNIDDFIEENRRKINRILGIDLTDKLIKNRRLEKRLLQI